MIQNKHRLGAPAIFFAAVLWSTSTPFTRGLQVDSFTVVGIRALVAGLLLLPFLRPRRIKLSLHLLGFLVSFAGLAAGVIYALKTTGTPIAIGMQYTACFWLLLLSRPTRRDLMPRRIWPMAVLLLGVILSMCSKSELNSLSGNIVAVLTGFGFTGITWFGKKVATENPVGLSALANLFTAAVMLIVTRPTVGELAAITPEDWLALLYLGVFQIGIPYAMYYWGLRYVSTSTASMLTPTEMILGPIWTLIFHGELPDLIGIVGFSLVVVGVVGEAVVSSLTERRALAAESAHNEASQKTNI